MPFFLLPYYIRRYILKKFFAGIILPVIAWGAMLTTEICAQADVVLVQNGVAKSAIYVAPAVMTPDRKLEATATFAQTDAENKRRKLRESVNDLAHYLQKMSGAKVGVLQRAPAAKDKRLPIVIGAFAASRFKGNTPRTPSKQGFRVVVSSQGIGLMGESDEATSYAIYEVLHRLGCRWYMPSELGEVVPARATISLPAMDFSSQPGTISREIWYADDAFKRRNRLGGPILQTTHALEHYITKEQREAHPEWRAIIGGQPHALRLKWSHPGVQQAVADAIIKKLDARYEPSISLSPEDGVGFDESDDRTWDAGDFDPTLDQVSITDRYVKFCNIVVEKVAKKHPDVLFGFLAYVQYTRPPTREKPHPNLIPVIAPITYCRAHAMTDTHICPSRPQIRPIVEGWAKVSPRVAYYNYMYHLAEVSAPYPMMRQMKEELPVLYKNNVQFWQPETMPNFESILPGMTLTIRKAWNPNEDSQAILDELFNGFYGASQKPMRDYWQTFDDAWAKPPLHAGSGFSYLRRFTPEVLGRARVQMNAALEAASTPTIYRRVKLHEESLRQFERWMGLRRDLIEGRLADLDLRNTEWLGTQYGLGNEYAPQQAFTKAFGTHTISGAYHKWFFEPPYLEGARIAREYSVIGAPLRDWRYAVDKGKTGEKMGWQHSTFDAAAWKTTDVAVEMWADLGLMDYMGTMWYRQTVKIPAAPTGKKTWLWLSSTDGSAKVFVNGKHVPYIDANGAKADEFSGHCQPASFDISSVIKAGEDNQIAIVATRTFLNELGTGGLIGPVYLYQEK